MTQVMRIIRGCYITAHLHAPQARARFSGTLTWMDGQPVSQWQDCHRWWRQDRPFIYCELEACPASGSATVSAGPLSSQVGHGPTHGDDTACPGQLCLQKSEQPGRNLNEPESGAATVSRIDWTPFKLAHTSSHEVAIRVSCQRYCHAAAVCNLNTATIL